MVVDSSDDIKMEEQDSTSGSSKSLVLDGQPIQKRKKKLKRKNSATTIHENSMNTHRNISTSSSATTISPTIQISTSGNGSRIVNLDGNLNSNSRTVSFLDDLKKRSAMKASSSSTSSKRRSVVEEKPVSKTTKQRQISLPNTLISPVQPITKSQSSSLQSPEHQYPSQHQPSLSQPSQPSKQKQKQQESSLLQLTQSHAINSSMHQVNQVESRRPPLVSNTGRSRSSDTSINNMESNGGRVRSGAISLLQDSHRSRHGGVYVMPKYREILEQTLSQESSIVGAGGHPSTSNTSKHKPVRTVIRKRS